MNPAGQIKLVYEKFESPPDVTWVGPNPEEPGLVLGFDNGMILSTTATGKVGDLQPSSPAEEAINGVASVGPASLAVSTRSEVSFIQASHSTGLARAVFPGGAHGVIATKSGAYVAPLGPEGLLIVPPADGEMQRMEVARSRGGELYIYRAASVHDQLGMEVLILANRKCGLGLSLFKAEERSRVVHSMGFEGIDVVDACAVSEGSLSAFAITKTADLLWIKDASKFENPVILRLRDVIGSVYRILATSRHLFLLTSKAIYVWFDLVHRALVGKFSSPGMVRFMLPTDSIDMSLIDEKYLLLVMGSNSVVSLSIADIEVELNRGVVSRSRPGLSSSSLEETFLDDIDQDWHVEDVEQRDLAVA